MTIEEILDKLWEDYSGQNPSVEKIHRLFKEENEEIINDHIAFRTFNSPDINVDVLSRPFIKAGYIEKEEYQFEEKKLFAKHFEHSTDPKAPKIFISELKTEEFSPFLQETVKNWVGAIPEYYKESNELIFSGNQWIKPSYETYLKLREESEYAAWFYVYGFRANHFTVFSNFMNKYEKLEDLNSFLKDNGFKLNVSGGEIKGTPEQFLEQSSTLADIIPIEFEEGIFEIPSCFYEFARRYPKGDGELFSGFIAASANKIFESTNYYGS